MEIISIDSNNNKESLVVDDGAVVKLVANKIISSRSASQQPVFESSSWMTADETYYDVSSRIMDSDNNAPRSQTVIPNRTLADSRTFGDRFIENVFSPPTSSSSTHVSVLTTPLFLNSANNDLLGSDGSAINETTEQNNDFPRLYCETLEQHGFTCSDSYAASKSVIDTVCDNFIRNTPDENCIGELVFQRMHLENERLFYVYLSVATPLVIIGLVFNAIALASVVSLRHKLSRHLMLILMSLSDAIVSLVALLRRIDGSLLAGTGQLYLIAIWQMSWLLSALSLLGLAVDMFIALAKPYSYDRPIMKRATVIAICTAVFLAASVVIFLAVFDVQESDNGQYFACGIIVIIITCMCASHIYACVSAEIVQMQIKRSQQLPFFRQNSQPTNSNSNSYYSSSSNRCSGQSGQQNNHNHSGGENKSPASAKATSFLRKSVVTTSLLIMSSLLSWIPLLVYWLIDDSTKEANVPAFIRILTLCLICFHMNAVVNPLIYSFRFRDVRNSLKRMFRNYLTCCPEDVRKHLMNNDRKNSLVNFSHQQDFLTSRSFFTNSRRPSTIPRCSVICSDSVALTTPEHQRLLSRSNADFNRGISAVTNRNEVRSIYDNCNNDEELSPALIRNNNNSNNNINYLSCAAPYSNNCLIASINNSQDGSSSDANPEAELRLLVPNINEMLPK